MRMTIFIENNHAAVYLQFIIFSTNGHQECICAVYNQQF